MYDILIFTELRKVKYMEKIFVKCTALIVSVALILSAGLTVAFSAKEKTTEDLIKEGERKTRIVNILLDKILIGGIAKAAPRLSFVRNDDEPLSDDNFYPGDNTFMPVPTDNFNWSLGYGSESIIPDDFGVPFKYARGSYVPWFYSTDFYTDDDGNKETMKVRTVILDDNTGRGRILISSVDCIGISNTDVLKIRNGLKDFAERNNVKAIEISAIHSHMAIDSQGVWGHPLGVIINNLLSITGIVKPKSGVEKDYLDKITSATLKSAETALAGMKTGLLNYTDIELEGYMGTRTVSKECDGNIHKIMFVPSDGSKGTVMASFGVHPELTSYGHEMDSRLSADFVYYMEKLINKAGYNFLYIQGNVGTNGPWTSKANDGMHFDTPHEETMRYGYEMAYITLGASMNTEQRIELNNSLGDMLGIKEFGNNEGYTKWYDDLNTFEDIPVEAALNVKHSRVKLEMDNSTSLALLKLGIASNDISYSKSERKYYTTTEIGLIQFGNAVKMFLCPGEMYSELYVGGYGLNESPYKSLREEYGDDVILCDLMNDAAGYICPDEHYGLITYRLNPQNGQLEEDSWCLAVSIGSKTASTIMAAYKEMMENVSASVTG